jgi:ABC-type transporter Mla MlaB component
MMSSSSRRATALSNPNILLVILGKLDKEELIATRSVNSIWSRHATQYFWRLASCSQLEQVPLGHCGYFAALIELFNLTLP